MIIKFTTQTSRKFFARLPSGSRPYFALSRFIHNCQNLCTLSQKDNKHYHNTVYHNIPFRRGRKKKWNSKDSTRATHRIVHHRLDLPEYRSKLSRIWIVLDHKLMVLQRLECNWRCKLDTLLRNFSERNLQSQTFLKSAYLEDNLPDLGHKFHGSRYGLPWIGKHITTWQER